MGSGKMEKCLPVRVARRQGLLVKFILTGKFEMLINEELPLKTNIPIFSRHEG